MTIPPLLRDLLTVAGGAGGESAPAAVFREAGGAFAEVTSDTLGSVVARVKGTAGGPLLAIVGHIDEIGLIVTHADDEGFLWFRGVGGWDPQVLVGQRVEIAAAGGKVPGVVGRKPIHLLKDEERKKVVDLDSLHIDIGANDGDEARSLVRIGDTAVITGEPFGLPNDRLVSRALDNRVGAYVALEAARLVAEAGGAAGDVAAIGAVQEEITFAGARTSAFSLDPAAAVVVDVTFASDAPGVDVKQVGKAPFGSGPALTRGSIVNPRLLEVLVEAAEAEEIPHTLHATGRGTSTDADVVHLSRAGVPTAVVSVPLRYMHSPVEMIQLDDVEASARLIAAAALRIDAAETFGR